MARNLLLLFIFLGISFGSSAQEKKYVLVEHFTNTPCPICASRNPQLFTTIENYPDDVHHVSFHPPYPYSSCIFYQHNPSENIGRAQYYEVQGSPTAVVQGTLINGSPLLPESEITDRLGETAQVSLIVSETGTENRSVSIEIKNLLDIELSGNYKLYVAVVEKEIQYSAPNGETLHHNVFRRYLTGLEGKEISFIPEQDSQTEVYDYGIDSEWNSDEVYILAYLQNAQTNEILNSGSSLDQVISADQTIVDSEWTIHPNPAEGVVTVRLPSGARKVRIHSITGQVLYDKIVLPNADRHFIDVSDFRKGTYFLRIEGGNMVHTRKLMRI